MKRRRAIQTLATAAAALPLLRVSLDAHPFAEALAQVESLSADHLLVLRDVAGTVLPSALGREAQDAAVDKFVRWIRDYKQGVALSHGYGEPRLIKSGATPAAGYGRQIAALQEAAQARGGKFSA